MFITARIERHRDVRSEGYHSTFSLLISQHPNLLISIISHRDEMKKSIWYPHSRSIKNQCEELNAPSVLNRLIFRSVFFLLFQKRIEIVKNLINSHIKCVTIPTRTHCFYAETHRKQKISHVYIFRDRNSCFPPHLLAQTIINIRRQRCLGPGCIAFLAFSIITLDIYVKRQFKGIRE